MGKYKILYVEDDLNTVKTQLSLMFPDFEVAIKKSRSITDLESILPTYIDIASEKYALAKALELIRKNHDKYLFFIIDRDLDGGNRDEGSIKKIWPEISEDKLKDEEYRSGDLLLEYLLIACRFNKEDIVKSFCFFTGHRQLNDETRATLKLLHFNDDEIDSLIFVKGTNDDDDKIEERFLNSLGFYIQNKHKDVFDALENIAEDLSLNKDEHHENLIKALAYAEGIALEGQKPEKPSLSLLREVGEAFRLKISKIANQLYDPSVFKIEGTGDPYSTLSTLIEGYGNNCPILVLPLAAMTIRYHNKKNNKNFDIKDMKPTELFNPPIDNDLSKEAGKTIKNYQEKYKHIASCMDIIQTIASQEIHHTTYEFPQGNKRLQILIYAVCELLLFYYQNKDRLDKNNEYIE